MAAASNQSDSELFIEYALRMTKGRFRSLALGTAVLLMAATTALFLLGAVAADHVLSGGLSASARMVLRWFLVTGELAIAILLLARPLVRRINNLYVARLIEKAHPEFRNDLTAALELSDDRGVDRGALAAIKRRAAREVAETDVEASVATRNFRLGSIIFALAAGAFAMYCLLSPKSVLVSVRRVLGDDRAAAPTRTHILAVRPEAGSVVVTGQPVTFTAEVLGGRGPVTLRISRDAGRTFLAGDALEMEPRGRTPSGSEVFLARWRAAAGAGGVAAFEVGSGDTRSGLRKLVVLPAPALREIQARLDWPAYTGRGATVSSTGNVEALRARANAPGTGTKVTIRARANFPVVSASMIFADSPPLIMTTQDGTMTAEFELSQSDSYRIAYRGAHPYLRGQSIPYRLKAIADSPPTVRLTEPIGRVELSAGGSLRLAGEATDDFGLASVELVIRRDDGQRRIGLARPRAPGARSRAIETLIPAEDIGAAGELLRCGIEARDFRPPGGQVGRSRTFEVSIAAPERPAAIENSEISGTSESRGQAPRAASGRQATRPTGGDGADASRRAVSELLEMARRDARELEVLRAYLSSGEKGPEAPDAPVEGQRAPGESGASRQLDDTQAGRRQVGPEIPGEDGFRGDQRTPEALGGLERDEGQGRPPGHAQTRAQGRDQAVDRRANPQEAPGEDQSRPAASKPGKSANGEKVQGQGNAQAQGAGGSQGQGRGQAQAQGTGSGQGRGQGSGQASGSGQGQGATQGQGSAQGGAGRSAAAGMHSAGGGGNPNVGSASRRGEVDVPEASGVTPEQAAHLQSIGRVIDEAQRRIRGGKVNPELLKELGMTSSRFAAFVERYNSRFGRIAEMPRRTDRPGRSVSGAFKLTGSGALQKGRAAGERLGDVSGAEKLPTDRIRNLLQPRLRKVSPEYRKEVEAYFRAISQGPRDAEAATRPAE